MAKAGLVQEVKERPIIFGAWKLKRILEWDFGRDGDMQTRRVMKPQPGDGCEDEHGPYYQKLDSRVVAGMVMAFADRVRPVCPYGKPGDHLWTRETHRYNHYEKDGREYYMTVEYRDGKQRRCATGLPFSGLPEVGLDWRSPYHMHRWASRILLELTSVRVERLWEIGAESCVAEGIEPIDCLDCDDYSLLHRNGEEHLDEHEMRHAFAQGWDVLSKARGFGWDKNPWVWVLSFRRLA
jgi:hypothetical protein